ncbi:MAG: sigma-70 family RNA polymerase sigma factor [Acidobacteriota bacterium]
MTTSEPTQEAHQVTGLLQRWRAGDEAALEALVPLVYETLLKMARGQFRRERVDHTLQPTALVHEAYVRLLGPQNPEWEDRTHFFGIAALVMRRVLIDHARSHQSLRRSDGSLKVDFEEALEVTSPQRTTDLLALDEALDRLERRDPRKARLVQLRFFGGLTLDEVAEILQVSQATVVRDWRLARAWLLTKLGSENRGPNLSATRSGRVHPPAPRRSPHQD